MTLAVEHAFTLDVDIAAPIEVGAVPTGFRRVIPITGGRVHGPKLNGTVLAGGTDWNLIRTDGAIHVWARYEIRTDEGRLSRSPTRASTSASRPTPPPQAARSSRVRPPRSARADRHGSTTARSWASCDRFRRGRYRSRCRSC
ncbi:MAG: DUF3237 domain-containing protein [Streptosporangiaceae bacterium]